MFILGKLATIAGSADWPKQKLAISYAWPVFKLRVSRGRIWSRWLVFTPLPLSVVFTCPNVWKGKSFPGAIRVHGRVAWYQVKPFVSFPVALFVLLRLIGVDTFFRWFLVFAFTCREKQWCGTITLFLRWLTIYQNRFHTAKFRGRNGCQKLVWLGIPNFSAMNSLNKCSRADMSSSLVHACATATEIVTQHEPNFNRSNESLFFNSTRSPWTPCQLHMQSACITRNRKTEDTEFTQCSLSSEVFSFTPRLWPPSNEPGSIEIQRQELQVEINLSRIYFWKFSPNKKLQKKHAHELFTFFTFRALFHLVTLCKEETRGTKCEAKQWWMPGDRAVAACFANLIQWGRIRFKLQKNRLFF